MTGFIAFSISGRNREITISLLARTKTKMSGVLFVVLYAPPRQRTWFFPFRKERRKENHEDPVNPVEIKKEN